MTDTHTHGGSSQSWTPGTTQGRCRQPGTRTNGMDQPGLICCQTKQQGMLGYRLSSTQQHIDTPVHPFPSHLFPDASCLCGIGYALIQYNGQQTCIVLCGSRSLSDAKANYAIIELECLAIIWAIKIAGYIWLDPTFKSTLTISHSNRSLKWRALRISGPATHAKGVYIHISVQLHTRQR